MEQHEHRNDAEYGGNENWNNQNQNFGLTHHSPPVIFEHPEFSYWQSISHVSENHKSYNNCTERISFTQSTPQQSLPLAPWPSMLTNSANFPGPLVAIPSPVLNTPKIGGSSSSPRKTLTDDDRRRICQLHEDHPSMKQTEIGAKFGVERSTVSKVLRQKDKYLSPENRSSSPVKRGRGKFPDIERTLSSWVRNFKDQGLPITDDQLRSKAHSFAKSLGQNDNYLKINDDCWLEKFKQKNGIENQYLITRASETNPSSSGSPVTLDCGSASHSSSKMSPASSNAVLSPPPFSSTVGKIKEEENSDQTTSFMHMDSQSGINPVSDHLASSSSAPFLYSIENTTVLSPPQNRLPLPESIQRIRRQTFPAHEVNTTFCIQDSRDSHINDNTSPEPSSATESQNEQLASPQSIYATISTPPLPSTRIDNQMNLDLPRIPIFHNHQQNTPDLSAPSSPTEDDARRALDTLLNFFAQPPNSNLVNKTEYITVMNLTQKMRFYSGEFQNIANPGGEMLVPKFEQSMHAGC